MAFLRQLRTITILVKQVVMIRIEGRSASTVSPRRISRRSELSPRSMPPIDVIGSGALPFPASVLCAGSTGVAGVTGATG